MPHVSTHVNSPSSSYANKSTYSVSENEIAQYIEILKTLTPSEVLILNHICFYANKSWGFCLKSYKTIAAELKISKQTVYRAMLKLKDWILELRSGGPTASKIFVKDSVLKQVVQHQNQNVYAMSTVEPPTLYLKNIIDQCDETSVESFKSLEPKKKEEGFSALRKLGLSLVEAGILWAYIKTNKIPPEVTQESILAVTKEKVRGENKKSIRSIGAYFRAVLNQRWKSFKDAISDIEKKTPKKDLSDEFKQELDYKAWDKAKSDCSKNGLVWNVTPGYMEIESRLREKYYLEFLEIERSRLD